MKKKTVLKKTQATPKKSTPLKKPKSAMIKQKLAAKSSSLSDSDDNSDNKDNDSPSNSSKNKTAFKKYKRPSVVRKAPIKTSDFKELVVRKRMASLNASAMMAATYEVERHLDHCESIYNNSSGGESEVPNLPKKAKAIKDEILDTKDVRK